MTDNVHGFVPAASNPLNTDNRAHGALVRGGFAAMHGEPAIDWSGVDVEEPKVAPKRPRGRPRKVVD